jgi:hypothetical protein
MKCEKCQGTGKVGGGRVYCLIDLPCGDCGGTGEIHCCDGLQEQPDSMPSDGEADVTGYDGENYLWNEARAATAKLKGWDFFREHFFDDPPSS